MGLSVQGSIMLRLDALLGVGESHVKAPSIYAHIEGTTDLYSLRLIALAMRDYTLDKALQNWG
jgi:hypothetical protein